MPKLIQFRRQTGVLHVPVTDIAGIERRDDGTGVVTFKNGLQPITVKRADAIIDAMRGGTEQVSTVSLFDQIFGKW